MASDARHFAAVVVGFWLKFMTIQSLNLNNSLLYLLLIYIINQGKRDVETVLAMGIMDDVGIIPQPSGGAGFGPGIPGLQLGLGVGVGCGVGVGFGYGVGKGVAYDENRRYSNVGKPPFNGSYVPSQLCVCNYGGAGYLKANVSGSMIAVDQFAMLG